MDAVRDDPFEVIETPEPEVVPVSFCACFAAADVEDESLQSES